MTPGDVYPGQRAKRPPSNVAIGDTRVETHGSKDPPLHRRELTPAGLKASATFGSAENRSYLAGFLAAGLAAGMP